MLIHNITILISKLHDFTTSWCLSFLTSFPKMILTTILLQPFHSHGPISTPPLSLFQTLCSLATTFCLSNSTPLEPPLQESFRLIRTYNPLIQLSLPFTLKGLSCLSAKLKITQPTIIITPLYTPSPLPPCPHSH